MRFGLVLVSAAAALSLGAPGARAQISDDVVKIGVLNDQSGLYADLGGPGSVVAARMAKDYLSVYRNLADCSPVCSVFRGMLLRRASPDHSTLDQTFDFQEPNLFPRTGRPMKVGLRSSDPAARVLNHRLCRSATIVCLAKRWLELHFGALRHGARGAARTARKLEPAPLCGCG